MAIPFLMSVDMNLNQILNALAQNLATDPASPAAGQFWFNTTTKKFCYYSGDAVISALTSAELTEQLKNYQAKITASGLLKGDGAGGVTAASAGTDYQSPLTFDDAPASGSTNPVKSGGVYQALAGKQNTIKVTGLVKCDGSGGLSAAAAGTDYQAPLTFDTAPKQYSSNPVTSGGVYTAVQTVQTAVDNIPKYNYLDAVACSVADGSAQSAVNTAAVAAISEAYGAPTKWDAVVCNVAFTPSDVEKDALYFYNGSAWTFLYYVTTGVQQANGETAGIVESSDDITFAAGQGTVNQAARLKNAIKVTLSGVTATEQSFDGSSDLTIPVTAVPVSLLSGTLSVPKGGTGKTTFTAGQVLVGNGTGALTQKAIDTSVTSGSENLITSGAVYSALSSAGTVRKYTATNGALSPSGGVCSWTVTHNLGTRNVIVDVSQAASPYNQVMVEAAKTSENAVTIYIDSSATIAAGTYTVTVLG